MQILLLVHLGNQWRISGCVFSQCVEAIYNVAGVRVAFSWLELLQHASKLVWLTGLASGTLRCSPRMFTPIQTIAFESKNCFGFFSLLSHNFHNLRLSILTTSPSHQFGMSLLRPDSRAHLLQWALFLSLCKLSPTDSSVSWLSKIKLRLRLKVIITPPPS